MSPVQRFALLICLMAPAAPAQAWGPPGHEIIGALAELQLRPGAHSEVDRLLAGEPLPSLAGIANWADTRRESETGRGGTRSWHYVNFRGGICEYVPPRDCPDGNCIIGAINRQFLLLADRRRPDTERREALKFLVHLVGDIHQPLHAGSRGDHGGNDFQVAYRGKGRNLHEVWDGQILSSSGRSAMQTSETLWRMPALPRDATGRSDRPAVDWALESCKIAGTIYPSGHVIGDDYLRENLPLVQVRLRLAGARLAGMINYALDPPQVRPSP